MAHRKPISEEKINARLREVTAELRKLRTELEEGIRSQRREPKPFVRAFELHGPSRPRTRGGNS
jgi:hypothetical protein